LHAYRRELRRLKLIDRSSPAARPRRRYGVR
jgi:hypothetical protein